MRDAEFVIVINDFALKNFVNITFIRLDLQTGKVYRLFNDLALKIAMSITSKRHAA